VHREEHEKRPITTDSAPLPKGPYSQAVLSAGRCLYISGQGPVDAASGEFVVGSFDEQARFDLAQCASARRGRRRTHWLKAIKVHVYLRDMKDFQALNSVYAEFFPEPQPARTTVQSNLPGFDLEIDAIIALDA